MFVSPEIVSFPSMYPTFLVSDESKETELGFELARLGLRDRVQLLVKSFDHEQGV